MKRLIGAVLAGFLATAACASSADDPGKKNEDTGSQLADVELGNSDDGTTVAVTQGETIRLVLQTIGPGDYMDPDVSSPAVEFVSSGLEELQNPGGPRRTYHFLAREAGTSRIQIPHSGSLATFTLTLSVR